MAPYSLRTRSLIKDNYKKSTNKEAALQNMSIAEFTDFISFYKNNPFSSVANTLCVSYQVLKLCCEKNGVQWSYYKVKNNISKDNIKSTQKEESKEEKDIDTDTDTEVDESLSINVTISSNANLFSLRDNNYSCKVKSETSPKRCAFVKTPQKNKYPDSEQYNFRLERVFTRRKKSTKKFLYKP